MRVIIAGGGAAGFFAAITCKEKQPDSEVIIIESSSTLLQKVFLSGGKRCNLSNSQQNLRLFCSNYPRGSKELYSLFHHFGPRETFAWFQSKGIPLKIENDGRIFPQSDRSQSVVDCFINTTRKSNIRIITNCGLLSAIRLPDISKFQITLTDNNKIECDRLILATGGSPKSAGIQIAQAFGHTIIDQIPSLFAFIASDNAICSLPGLSVSDVSILIPKTTYKERGSILITHNGISGPAVLRLSAFAARELYDKNYKFTCNINWLPGTPSDQIETKIAAMRKSSATRKVCSQSPFPLPSRLWQTLVILAGCESSLVWANLSKKQAFKIVELITRYSIDVTGRDTNRSEFVTCGGIKLSEVNFKTMESILCPHLHFAGEILDIDGITGGFNLQAAWSTGYIAGSSIS